MPADLPGYYFDASKNRYFKITANHIAQGSSSTSTAKYARQAVQAQQAVEQSEQREKLFKASKDAVTVKRSKLFFHPLLNFESQLGNRKKSAGGVVKEFYAASLNSRPAFGPNPIRGQNGSGQLCGKFSVEEETGLLITVANGGRPNEPDSIWLFQPVEDSEFLYPRGHTVPNFSGITTVDHILSLGQDGVNVWAHRRFSLLNGQTQSQSTLSVTRHSLPDHDGTVNEEVGVEFRLSEAVMDLATGPNHDAFAAADATGVTIRWPDVGISQKVPQAHGPSESAAVWFKDNNVLLHGARNGQLRMADLRFIPRPGFSDLRVQHDSAISHIRTVGPHQVLVHGLKSTSLYDLRWCPQPRMSTNNRPMDPRHQERNMRAPTYNSSQPYLTFHVPEIRRQNRYGLGFAYDAELNIVLGASTDFHRNHRVNLWDASTGRLLQSPLVEHTFEQPVTCAQVVDLRPQAKSFLLATNGVVQEWCPL
jgi:hypothetical protein